MTIADLIAEVAAEHVMVVGVIGADFCKYDTMDWPCDAARLAAALSPENVAAGLLAAGEPSGMPALSIEWYRHYAAALLAAMTVP